MGSVTRERKHFDGGICPASFVHLAEFTCYGRMQLIPVSGRVINGDVAVI